MNFTPLKKTAPHKNIAYVKTLLSTAQTVHTMLLHDGFLETALLRGNHTICSHTQTHHVYNFWHCLATDSPTSNHIKFRQNHCLGFFSALWLFSRNMDTTRRPIYEGSFVFLGINFIWSGHYLPRQDWTQCGQELFIRKGASISEKWALALCLSSRAQSDRANKTYR